MAKTPSSMLPLGTTATDFTLPDVISEQSKSLSVLKSPQATVIAFICNHCPFVVHIIDTLVEVANHYLAKGISFIAISSNDIASYPQDGPKAMKLFAKAHAFSFPYLYDESQAIAKAYHAACTPDFFVFDGALSLVYRGQFDGARPGNDIDVSGQDLSTTLDALLSGTPVSTDQKPSIGCNIKWKN